MKKFIKIVLLIFTTFMMFGCKNSDPNYISIKDKYLENKEILDSWLAHKDIKTYCEIYDEEYYDNGICYSSKFKGDYFILKYIGGVEFNYNRALYYYSAGFKNILVFEMESEDDAQAACEEYNRVNPLVQISYYKNIVSFDPTFLNLLIGTYILENNYYISEDGNTLFTNLSDDKTLYLPNVQEVDKKSFCINSNIETVHFSSSIRKINSLAFSDCYNLKHVYLNFGLKEICVNAFYYCSSLEYVVIPKTVEYVEQNVFTHGIIYCEAKYKPVKWSPTFAGHKAKVLWGNEWHYDENGIPKPNNINDINI